MRATDTTSPCIWINAGEASGDMHGAALLRALSEAEPGLRAVGMGGEAMRNAGMDPDLDSSKLSALGFTEVFHLLPRVAAMLVRTWKLLKFYRPRAAVLLDTPDYCFMVARMCRRLNIPVYFYISPQVWAWRTGRVGFLRRHAEKVLCILPFETDFYAEHDVPAEFVGHPILDEIDIDGLLALEPEKHVVGILPGSRRKEIESLLPELAGAARLLKDKRPELSFRLFRAPGVERERLLAHLPASLEAEVVEPDERYRHMRTSRLLLAASGTVSLETALLGVPTVVTYKLSPLTHFLARRVISVDYISIPNLVLGKPTFPELIQSEAEAGRIAETAARWLDDPKAEREVRDNLAQLRHKMGRPGAAKRAASIILDDLKNGGNG